MGRSRIIRDNTSQRCQELRLEIYNMPTWPSIRNHHRQRLAIHLADIRGFLCELENLSKQVHTEIPARQRTSRSDQQNYSRRPQKTSRRQKRGMGRRTRRSTLG
ncbi:unnamed protein product, partial [Arabidopsis halleri]